MNSQEKIEVAGRKKEEKNLLFKNGRYQQAGKKYDKAADYVSEDESFGDNEQKLVKSLRVSYWLNGAACILKLHDYQEAIRLCSKVLDYEFLNLTALYRRAQSYMGSADLVLAESDIKKAIEADMQNRVVKLLQKTLKQLQTKSNNRDAKLYANKFARVTKDSSIAAKVEKSKDEKRQELDAAMETEKQVDTSAPSDNGTVVNSC